MHYLKIYALNQSYSKQEISDGRLLRRRKMNTKDVKTKRYLKVGKRYADIFNFFLHNGKQVIKPEDLVEKDITELLSLYYGMSEKEITKQKWRDLLKRAIIATANGTCYVLLGIENQSEIHYAMPVRNMIYDAINYGTQVEEARSRHEGCKNVYADNGEFLSGFTRADKITPVVTLVVYWGNDKWDGPKSLHEMMEVEDETILQYVPNYRINLLEPSTIEDFSKFQTSVGKVFEIIKASKDMNRMKEIMENDESYRHLEVDAVRMINEFTNMNIEIKAKERYVDMCKAWEDWKEYNYEKGINEGEQSTLVRILKNIMQSLSLTVEQAMQVMMIPEQEWDKYRSMV